MHKLDILHFGDGFAHAIFLRHQATQDIGFGAVAQCGESVDAASLFFHNVAVGGIAMHDFAMWEHVHEIGAAIFVRFNDFHLHIIFFKFFRHLHGNGGAAHNEHFFHLHLSLTAQLHHLVQVVACGSDICHIVVHHDVVATRNQNFTITANGIQVNECVAAAYFTKAFAHHRRSASQFHGRYNQLTVEKFKPVAHPVVLQRCGDFLGCEKFWVNQRVNAHSLEKLGIFWAQKLIIVDSRHGFFRTHALSDRASQYVARFVRCNGDKQAAVAHSVVLKCLERCALA